MEWRRGGVLVRLALPLVAVVSAHGCNCFGGGTWIALRRGRKPLREVEVGDQVLSFDVQRGRVCERDVLRVFRHGPRPVGRLVTQGGNGPARITANHPVFLERTGEFSRADALDARRLARDATARTGLSWTGTKLRRADFVPFEVGESSAIEEVFNLQIAETETYFADGLLVHNKSSADYDYQFDYGYDSGGGGLGGHAGEGSGGQNPSGGSSSGGAGPDSLGGTAGAEGGEGGLGGLGGAD